MSTKLRWGKACGRRALVKYGQALAKCVIRALADVVSGKATRADQCVAAAPDKALAAATKFGLSLPAFGPGTGCYEAPNDTAGLIDGVDRLAADVVPRLLCFDSGSPGVMVGK